MSTINSLSLDLQSKHHIQYRMLADICLSWSWRWGVWVVLIRVLCWVRLLRSIRAAVGCGRLHSAACALRHHYMERCHPLCGQHSVLRRHDHAVMCVEILCTLLENYELHYICVIVRSQYHPLITWLTSIVSSSFTSYFVEHQHHILYDVWDVYVCRDIPPGWLRQTVDTSLFFQTLSMLKSQAISDLVPGVT